MRRIVLSLWLCFAAYCGTQTNTAPLAFGMTPEQAEAALGVPLAFHSESRGSQIFLAVRPTGVPGFYPVTSALALQFRRGHLTGWKKDWRVERPF